MIRGDEGAACHYAAPCAASFSGHALDAGIESAMTIGSEFIEDVFVGRDQVIEDLLHDCTVLHAGYQ